MYQSGPLSSCFLGFLAIFLFVGSSRTVVVRDLDQFHFGGWRVAWLGFMPILVSFRGDGDFGGPKFSGHVDRDLFFVACTSNIH